MAFPDFQPIYPDQTRSRKLQTLAVVAAAAGLFATIGPVTGSRDVAFSQTNHPVPFARTMLYQSLAYVEAAPFAEAPQVDKWFSPLSEPYKFKRSLPTHEQQALAFVKATPFAETVSVDRWLLPLSEPTRRIKRLEGGQATFVGPQPATIGSGDVLFNRSASFVLFSRSTVYQTYFAPVTFSVIETVTVDKWFAALSGPAPDSYESVDLSFTFSAVEPSFGWYEPLGEPVRGRAQSAAVRHSATAFVAIVTPETVTLDKWFGKLAEPTRIRRTPPSDVAFVATVAAATPGSGDVLFAGSNSSVPFQRSIQYPAKVEPVNFTASAETITPDKWLRPLSEPPRTRRAGLDQLAFVAPVLSERWFHPLSEPPKGRSVHVSQQSVAAFVAIVAPSEPISADKWFAYLSDPVRFRVIATANVPAFTIDPAAMLLPSPVVPPVVIEPAPAGGGAGSVFRGGPSTFRWPAVKKKKKTYLEELEELEAFLRAVAERTPKIAEIERPPTVYRGPLAAAFFDPPRFEPKATPKPVAAKPIAPPVEAQRPNDDEEALLLLLNYEQELLLDLLRSLLPP